MEGRRWRPGRGGRGSDALPSTRSGKDGRGGAVVVDGMEGWRWQFDGGGEVVVARRRWILGATAVAVAPSPPPDPAGGEAAAAEAVTSTSGGFGSDGLFRSEHPLGKPAPKGVSQPAQKALSVVVTAQYGYIRWSPGTCRG
uniref:Uncharacterized protein n=1 Tax=Oryza meridionalis TaxID=40149 RepID=A0A0E0EBW2_9ORYZ